MKVLRTKNESKLAGFNIKIPAAMRGKIDELNGKVKAAGLIVDWGEPCISALERHIAAVEADLETQPVPSNF